MSHWEFEGYKNNTPHIGVYGAGSQFDFSVTYVNDSDSALEKCYLYTLTEFDGRIKARLSGGPLYLDVGVIASPSCSLGTFAVGNTEIDIRVEFDSALDGFDYLTIPLFLSHDIGSYQIDYLFITFYFPLWWECYDAYELWREDYVVPETACGIEFAAEGSGFNGGGDGFNGGGDGFV